MTITGFFYNIKKNKLARQLSLAVAGLTVAGSLWLGSMPMAEAMPEIMPVTELVKGMTGEAHTVVDSTGEIQSFDVEIVGVLGTGRGSRRMVLARASGPVVESVGGVLQGMSGSPVYIDGRLVGAAAATFKDMDAYMFLITPIEDMMEIWNMPDPKAVRKNKKIDIKKIAEEREKAEKARERREKLRKERRAKANGEETGKEKKPSADKPEEGVVGDLPADMRGGKKPKKPVEVPQEVKDDKHPDGYMKTEEVPAPNGEAEENTEKKSRYLGERRKLFISGFEGAAAGILASRLSPLGYDLQPFMGVSLAGGSVAGIQPAEPEQKKNEVKPADKPQAKAEEKSQEKREEKTQEKTEDKKAEKAQEDQKENKDKQDRKNKKDKKAEGAAAEKKAANGKADKKDSKKEDTKKENNILDKVELKSGLEKQKEEKPAEFIEVREPSGPVAIDFNPELEPGSPVGVAAVYGDFTVGATGTVTAVEGKKVLAFGHSFAHKGNTNFFMTDATVIGTVNGQTDGMKLANVGNIIGRINQDRGCGISGILGVYPSTVPIKLKVVDRSLNRKMYFAAQCAYDEDILPAVSAAIPVAAIARTCDSGAPATIGVKFRIKSNILAADAPPDAPEEAKSLDIERSNLFYSVDDGGLAAFTELNNIISLITANREEESDIYGIDVEITTEARQRTARLISATPSKPEVKPGEAITFKVVVKPFRGEKFTVEVPYTIPEARPEGKFYIDLHGGGLVQVRQVLAAAMLELEDKETVADKIRRMLQTYSNNEIVAEPAANPPLMGDKDQKKEIKKAIRRSEELEKKRRAKEAMGEKTEAEPLPEPFETDYIIENFVQTSVMVKY